MATTHQKLLNRIKDKLKKGDPIYHKLPDGGVLKMEQPVPFMMVYRIPKDGKDHFTSRLGKTESAYLIVQEKEFALVADLIHVVGTYLSDKFNGFLFIEVWLAQKKEIAPFTIYYNQKTAEEVAEKLADELNSIIIRGYSETAQLHPGSTVAPADCDPLLSGDDLEQHSMTLLGLQIAPVYLDKVTGKPYPLLLRDLRTKFSTALRKSIFEYIRLHTSYNSSNFQMLGTTTIDEVAKEVDQELSAYSRLFDFLFLVTPLNVDQAWADFKQNKFSNNPVFHYRPMPIDPEIVKRKLYNLPIEKITDPTIAFLFRDKRKEIDRMLNMMQEREKPDFLLSSLQLFGPVSEHELEIAKALLVAIEEQSSNTEQERISLPQFEKMAKAELAWLKEQNNEVATDIHIADDVEGILVSKGRLNINSNLSISKARAMPLLQHEVGTHVVTYYNGKSQPLELFSIGVPGYEELQEGLAVFAEYLMGGLTGSRMRTLAARVVAVHEMTTGKKFTETFH